MNPQAFRDRALAPMTMSLGLACLAAPAQAQTSCCAAPEVSSREACTPAARAAGGRDTNFALIQMTTGF